MEDVEYIKNEILKSTLLIKKELMKKIEYTVSKSIEERVYLYKKLQSINVFQELFIIACDRKEDNIYDSFIQVTKNFIDSCREQQPLEKSSWNIYLDTYITIDKLIKKALLL